MNHIDTELTPEERHLLKVLEKPKYDFHDTEVFLALSKRILFLEEHYNWQVDENRKVSRRMDEMSIIMGDLSVRLNKLKSSLREFEKQRIDPKFEEIKRDIDNLKDALTDD